MYMHRVSEEVVSGAQVRAESHHKVRIEFGC